MRTDAKNGDAERSPSGTEFELGGFALLLVGAGVLGLCVLSFWLGRVSVSVVPTAPRTPDAAMEDEGDLEEDLTFFDRLEQAPEISATARQPETNAARAEGTRRAPEGGSAGDAEAGTFTVQVLAATQRSAAEELVARLEGRGYRARLVVGEKDGERIYRVRVGGYRDETAAREAAAAIERQEGLRTWVIR